jgi:hypothetical protein
MNQKMNKSKVREMQNSSEIFKSNFDYYQRVAQKNIYDVTVDIHWSS